MDVLDVLDALHDLPLVNKQGDMEVEADTHLFIRGEESIEWNVISTQLEVDGLVFLTELYIIIKEFFIFLYILLLKK